MTDQPAEYRPEDQLSLAELVNRVLDRGAVIDGQVLISVAGIDLVYVGLRVIVAAAETVHQRSRLPEGEAATRADGAPPQPGAGTD